VAFILINIVINYILCVTTRNSQNKHYDSVVRELARATAFDYPETDEHREKWRQELNEMMSEKERQKKLQERHQMMNKYDHGDEEEQSSPSNDTGSQNASNSNASLRTALVEPQSDALKRRKIGTGVAASGATVAQPVVPMGRSWMWIGPNDWSYCNRSGLPKPPRSHFDHVTNSLVLNMDHYCPWMFNVIGYFNYRYFVNFLIYVAVGMMYGTVIMYQPFTMIDSTDYRRQISQSRGLYQKEKDLQDGLYTHVQHLIPNVPIPNEAAPIAFSFMMCVAVGLSVFILLVFHFYLIFTAQTTIEFHGNMVKREKCKMAGEVYSNPYDLGFRRNLEQVWGRLGNDRPFWLLFWTALLPSWRQTEFLPVPFHGEAGLRITWKQPQCLVTLEDIQDGGGFTNNDIV
jgi:hypothetical protein